jgi:prepilin-type N-terminal cleavage/methylation domain-containing protein
MIFNSARSRRETQAFTLIEVVVSMGILALLAASVYAIVGSSITASRIAMDQQLVLRRVDAFLTVTRDAFLNLPAEGSVSYEIGKGAGGQAEQRIILEKARNLFGLPSLGGGKLVLAARPQSDGTRTITLLRIPPNAQPLDITHALEAPGIPLLPGVIKPRWSFYANGNWTEECPEGSRPSLVKLQFELNDLPDPIESIFQVPTVTATQTPTPSTQPANPNPPPG